MNGNCCYLNVDLFVKSLLMYVVLIVKFTNCQNFNVLRYQSFGAPQLYISMYVYLKAGGGGICVVDVFGLR